MKKFWLGKSMAIFGVVCLAGSYASAQVLTGFVNHGVPAKISESRGIMAIRDKAGAPLILAFARDHYQDNPRTTLLIIDAKTGKTQQYWYPVRENANGEVFSSMRAPDGMIYTTIGDKFVEFDLEKREWTFTGDVDGIAMAFARSSDGVIFFGTYPNSSLYRFDPKTRVLEKLVQLDPKEQYPQYIAVGNDGWVYAGMGTARGNIVAYDPQTKELKQFVDEAARKTGSSYVLTATDGNIYGREFGADSGRLLRLEGGVATPVEGNPANPQRAVTGGLNWGNTLSQFPTGGGAIVSASVPDKTAEVLLDGKKERITFDYESNGMSISSLVVGPDAKVYGSTNHPMHFFSFDPKPSTLVDHGGMPQVAGGNFPAFAVSGKYLIGDSYSSGAVYEYDPAQPFLALPVTWNAATNAWSDPTPGEPSNPRWLGKYKDVTRPRVAVALPNGDVLFGGYGGYGITGGGLVTYIAATREAKAVPATEILPNHSTIALALLNDKTVVGGTTVETMGGGHPVATEAELYFLDIATQKVTYHTVPIPGARAILDVHVAPDGKVYGLANNAQFFVFDPKTKTVVHRADWNQWGSAFNPGNSMWNAPNGRVGVLLAKVILEIQPDYSVRKLADTPATVNAGGVVLNNRLYFGTSSSLQSVSLAPLAP
jgi:hypothetical protein